MGLVRLFRTFFQPHGISRLGTKTYFPTYVTYYRNPMEKKKTKRKRHVFVVDVAPTLTLLSPLQQKTYGEGNILAKLIIASNFLKIQKKYEWR